MFIILDILSNKLVQWNLVCDRRWMAAVSQSLYILGSFVGALILGPVSDRYRSFWNFLSNKIINVTIQTSIIDMADGRY